MDQNLTSTTHKTWTLCIIHEIYYIQAAWKNTKLIMNNKIYIKYRDDVYNVFSIAYIIMVFIICFKNLTGFMITIILIMKSRFWFCIAYLIQNRCKSILKADTPCSNEMPWLPLSQKYSSQLNVCTSYTLRIPVYLRLIFKWYRSFSILNFDK